jgi:hypothetical protein
MKSLPQLAHARRHSEACKIDAAASSIGRFFTTWQADRD